MADFLAADACHFCGTTYRVVPGSLPGSLPPPVGYLAGGSRVFLLGAFPVDNHPFCTRCLSHFEPAKGFGLVGWYNRSGQVTTVSGDVYEVNPVPVPHRGEGQVRTRSYPLRVVSPFKMNDKSLKLIHLIKFSGIRSAAPLAARSMAYSLGVLLRPDAAATLLVPVPMDPGSQRRRGFNQAEVLANGISGISGLPVAGDVLYKVLKTPPQSLTTRAQRAQNVRNAFAARVGSVRDKHVILVDDLLTTGATAAACASCLVGAGSLSVTVVCLARAL